ncbi:hypothetical protein NE237_026886 [Protea cynaroides]|uniref:ATP-dependent RNA helicase Ski2/MTR4 C-terminal domain-containing protein n=1 Tax=Protea cynaroides TaxID=273540 RepID=A0A9Q0GMH7_9MAGN|nr:hypothetical protein NE237_026886 [Protea cynaroides]
MFNGTFNDLDHHQQFQASARRISEVQRECKLDVNVAEYLESTVRPYLIDVIYCWLKGATFAVDIEMTDIFEGSIIQLDRRLDEFLNQLCAAAHAVGEVDLENKFAAASEPSASGDQMQGYDRKFESGKKHQSLPNAHFCSELKDPETNMKREAKEGKQNISCQEHIFKGCLGKMQEEKKSRRQYRKVQIYRAI